MEIATVLAVVNEGVDDGIVGVSDWEYKSYKEGHHIIANKDINIS